MKDALVWICMWVVGFALIYCVRPKRKNKFTRYKPSPDERDTLRFWRNSWRA